MASEQCWKAAQSSQHHQQKHDQHQQEHCFGHVSDKIKGVFQLGHHHGHGPVAHGHSGHDHNAAKHGKHAGSKKKEHRKKKEGGFLHKIKEAFSDHSSDTSDSSDDDCHKRKN